MLIIFFYFFKNEGWVGMRGTGSFGEQPQRDAGTQRKAGRGDQTALLRQTEHTHSVSVQPGSQNPALKSSSIMLRVMAMQ